MDRTAALCLQNTQRAVQPCSMAHPTPMKDAAVNRLAKSITELTLCQVTTSEVDAATKLLDKACQKLQGIQDVPSQRVIDLEASIRQLRQLSCILDSCTISASYEVSQAQKALLLLPHRAKRGKHIIGKAIRWLSWYGVGLASADRLPVVVRIPAGPLGSLKCDPPKGNGRRPQKKASTSSEELNAQISPRTDDEHNLPYHEDYWQEY